MPMAGDFNADWLANDVDYDPWQAGFGPSGLDGGDFLAWQRNVNTPPAASPPQRLFPSHLPCGSPPPCFVASRKSRAGRERLHDRPIEAGRWRPAADQISRHALASGSVRVVLKPALKSAD
jgi:hypothetical protein